VLALGMSPDRIGLVANALFPGDVHDIALGVTSAGPASYYLSIPYAKVTGPKRQDLDGLTQRLTGRCAPYTELLPGRHPSSVTLMRTMSRGEVHTSVAVNAAGAAREGDDHRYAFAAVKKVVALSRLLDRMFLLNSLCAETVGSLERERRYDWQWPIEGDEAAYAIPDDSAPRLYPVRVRPAGAPGGSWGYINSAGNLLVESQFEQARHFTEGMGGVRKGDQWGFVDASGHQAIGCRFDGAGFFSEGLAAVRQGLLWGYIDKTGHVAIQPRFAAGGRFQDGRAPACAGTGLLDLGGLWGYIGRLGQWSVEPQFVEAYSFGRAGLALASRDGLYGFVAQSGQFQVPPAFEMAGFFSEGLAYTWLDGRPAYVDAAGRVVFALPQAAVGFAFHEGLARVAYPSPSGAALWGFVDARGKPVIAPRFRWALDFSGGLAPVLGDEGDAALWGYVDRTGKMVIQPRFESAFVFLGELAEVEEDGRQGYINRHGTYVWREHP